MSGKGKQMKNMGIRMNQWKNILGGASMLLLVTACGGGSSDVSGSGPSTQINNPANPNTSSCNNTVVDYGLHAPGASAERGLYSDTKINPLTGLPVVAYTDSGVSGYGSGGSDTIMLSYEVLNGNGDYSWQHEVIAGDNAQAGGAAYLRLGITSTGIPMVYWTAGTTSSSVMMAGRSVALGSSTSPTWTVSAIATATGPGAGTLEVSVSPQNQVAIIYESTSTVTAGRPQFAYCSANCNVPSNYSAMVAGTFIATEAATASTAALQGVGAAWCNAGSGTYYPAVAYYSGANAKFSVCTQASLGNCTTAANWVGTGGVPTVVTAAETAATEDTIKLYLDPTVVGDKPKILARTTAAATLSASELNFACTNTAQTPVTNTYVITGTTGYGTQWATILKDSTGYFHVAVNNALTGVAYINTSSVNGNGTTAFGTANWNLGLPMFETTTLPAVSAAGGGAAIYNGSSPATSGVLYTSYAPVAGEFNLTLGTVSGLSGTSNPVLGLEYPNTAGGIQISNQLLQAGAAGYSAAYRNISASATSAGNPAVAYVDYSAAVFTNTTGVLAPTALLPGPKLKYAYRNGTTHSSDWIVNTIPGPILPQFPSLVFDANNLPWIGYLETQAVSGVYRYILLNNTKADGTGVWNSYVFPFLTKVAIANVTNTGVTDDVALAIYNSGGVSYPVMVVASSSAGAGGFIIKAGQFNPTTAEWTVPNLPVDNTITSGIEKLAIDSDGTNIVVAYYDLASTKLKLASSITGGLTWTVLPAVTSLAASGQGPSVKLLNGIPSLAYFVKSLNEVQYVQCTASNLTNCMSSTNYWASPVTVSNGNLGFISAGVGLTASADQYLSTSINFDSSSNAYVYYPLGASTGLSTAGLAVASGAANQNGSFTQSMLYSAMNATTLVNANAQQTNFALAGQQVSTVRSSSTGVPVAAYIGPGNWLYVTSCGD
jgi:hypothetical protein